MPFLIDGKLVPGYEHAKKADGSFVRPTDSVGGDGFEIPASHEVVLVVSAACPWSHRAWIALESSEHQVSVARAHPFKKDDRGWAFQKGALDDAERCVEPGENDPLTPRERALADDPDLMWPGVAWTGPLGAAYLHEVYLACDAAYTGRVTVPLLVDVTAGKLLCNDSAALLRHFLPCPPALRESVDRWNARIQPDINDGVYKAGLARSQAAYDAACSALFAALDEVDAHLGRQRFLASGETWTEADVRLYVTLVRFDAVYYALFKCCKRQLREYENLAAYTRDLYQLSAAFRATTDLRYIRHHYWRSFDSVNPKPRVVPEYDGQDLFLPHSRGSDGGTQAERGRSSADKKKEFVRGVAGFRGRLGTDEFPAEHGRYLLVVALNCPWSHRALLAAAAAGLLQSGAVRADIVLYRRDPDHGWQYDQGSDPNCTPCTLPEPVRYVPEIYAREGSTEKSVPLLYDLKAKRIVSNESADIARDFLTMFGAADRFVPPDRAAEISAVNLFVYERINNGAYRAGFSPGQAAHDEAALHYADALRWADSRLRDRPFLLGNELTEADIRLLPTVFRHDDVYAVRMRVHSVLVRQDLPHLQRWLNAMMDVPGVRHVSNLRHCLLGYFGRTTNGIVPLVLDCDRKTCP